MGSFLVYPMRVMLFLRVTNTGICSIFIQLTVVNVAMVAAHVAVYGLTRKSFCPRQYSRISCLIWAKSNRFANQLYLMYSVCVVNSIVRSLLLLFTRWVYCFHSYSLRCSVYTPAVDFVPYYTSFRMHDTDDSVRQHRSSYSSIASVILYIDASLSCWG